MSDITFLYKILDSPPAQPLPEKLPATDLDRKDGFIHLSTAKQTPITANLFFATCSKLWILKLRAGELDGELDYPSDLPGCAHVHKSDRGLGKGNIEAVIEVEKAGYDDWTAVPAMKDLAD